LCRPYEIQHRREENKASGWSVKDAIGKFEKSLDSRMLFLDNFTEQMFGEMLQLAI